VFSRAETVAIWIASCPAAAMIAAYAADAAGFALHPFALLTIALGAATAVAAIVRPRQSDGTELTAFALVTCGVAAWLLVIGWPALLPIGSGPDLTHHLLLVDYIDRTGHLVHDRALASAFGEMAEYTPGLHVLAVIVGRLTGRDGLHALYPIVAVSVALKAGFVFLIAGRCLAGRIDDRGQRTAFAIAAVVILAFPQTYALGSFAHDSFLPQVVSELFAIVMWLAVAAWDANPSFAAAIPFAVAAVAAFLTWPVWVGPPVVTFAVVACLRRDRPVRERVNHLAAATGPVALLAATYFVGRMSASAAMAASGGAVGWPTPATVGWLLLIAGTAGAGVAAGDSRARTIPILLTAIAVQAATLAMVASARHSNQPYLALKMVYLAIYPLAVGGAYALATIVRSANRPAPGRGIARTIEASGAAWTITLVLALLGVRTVMTTPRPAPVISDPMYDAGRWARTNVPRACVDYLVADDDSAYWLHLAVLGNPRGTPRSLDSATYEPQKAVERWILPGGLPYAIVERFDALPKDIRENVDVLARFGAAAVVKRRGAVRC
jgi:hypothetical protein